MSKDIFPDIWKETNVSSLFKRDDPSAVSKYRPITLLNTIGSPFYIKDIVKDIHLHIRLFADEKSLYLINDEPYIAVTQLSSNLAKIHTCAKRCLVKFNPAEPGAILISRTINEPYHPPLQMNDKLIKEVTSHKHLCIFFSNDGSWPEHIGHITSKAWTRLN